MTGKTQMEKIITQSFHNTAGIVIRKNNNIVYENYYDGYTKEQTVHIASVTKSILSILIGIAADKGILDIEQKILDFFPDYVVSKGEQTIQMVTIRDMLTMTVPYKCKTEPYVKVFTGKEWVRTALSLIGGKGKTGDFRYSPMVGVHVLSGILVKATRQPVLEFANENLFMPMDIRVNESIVFKDKEEQLAFLEERNRSGWVADPEGIHTAGWGLTLTTADMAKIGQLYLNRGMWNGKQLVSSDWVDISTVKHSRCDQFKLFYGYLWWIIDEKSHCFAAMGDGGNIIYVNQSKELVVAIACSYMPQAKDRLKLIKQYIEPVFG